MLKRIIDIILATVGLLISGPMLLACVYLIKKYDGGPALYRPLRAGKDNVAFRMFKLRSMVLNADKIGGSSTANTDNRITPVGSFIRRFKLDELMQLINVLKGDMSLVGPRPNLVEEVAAYTSIEKDLLNVRPGITDFSSIVFADEGSILEGRENPDLAYNQLIRPWKSRLGLFYIKNQSVAVDLLLVLFTALTIVSRPAALLGVTKLLSKLGADKALIEVSTRKKKLTPFPPPGLDRIVEAI